jgi:predicted RNA-binding protein YlxR (DUF448 family)
MLERPDHGEADAGPRKSGPERLCIATRAVKPVGEMLRFVVGPDTAIVPDVKAKLPGRGVWVTASRSALATAVSRKAFGRSFRRDVQVPADLVDVTEGLLRRSVLDALAVAHKSGRVTAGFAKVEAALANGPVLALIHAAAAGGDGVRKLNAALRRRFGEVAGVPADGSDVGGPAGGPAVIDLFDSAELDLALGRSNVVHAAVLAGPASAGFLQRWRVLERFRSGAPGLGRGDKGS